MGDGVARAYGLDNVMANELVEFEGGTMGLAFNLGEDNVGIIILGSESGIREGSIVRRTGRIKGFLICLLYIKAKPFQRLMFHRLFLQFFLSSLTGNSE